MEEQLQELQNTISQITSPIIQRQLLPVRVLFILFSAILFSLLIYFLRKTDWLKYYFGQDLLEFRAYKAVEAVEFVKKWEQAKQRLKKEWEAEWKLAIIEADKLLDDLLQRMGYTGGSLGERLDQLDTEIMPNIEEVWTAHKIRNGIVHDPNYALDLKRAKNLMRIYEEAFNYLGAF